MGARDRGARTRCASYSPIYVKAYVVRQKNDFVDAAAICEAVTRPSVRQTPVKTVEQRAARVTQRAHELLSRQRVPLINALGGPRAEFGILAPAVPRHVGRLIEKLADPTASIPSAVRDAVNVGVEFDASVVEQADEPFPMVQTITKFVGDPGLAPFGLSRER
jgi:transposase